MLFSKSTGGIYCADIHKGAIPDDAIDIPDELLASFARGEFSCFDVASGVVIRQAPTAPAQIIRITALQGLLAIDASGLADEYEAWANDPARTFAERAFINKAQEWRRDDATLTGAATALGLTAAQVDAMFELAATL